MIEFIVRSALRSRFLVIAIAAAIMVFGVSRLHDLPVDLYPEFSPPYVQVQTEALGLSAEEVEGLITIPLEADLLNGVSWVQTISSQSLPGLSTVTLVFEPGTDLMDARQLVAERLTQVGGLPQVSKPPVMLQPLSSTSRVMQIGLSSTDLSLIQMSVLARWTIVPRLMGVPGVANVSIWGERHRQLQVQVDPERLRAEDLSLQQIIETTGNAMWVSPLTFLNASTPGTGGFIDTPNQRLGIRHELPISSASELAEVIIDGTQLRLGDVGEVVEDHQLLIGDAIVNDEPGLLLVVEKFPWANTMEVTARGGSRARRAPSGPGRYGTRPRDLSAGDLHRDVARQSHHGAAHRCGPCGSGPWRFSVRLARGADQHRGDLAVAGDSSARARSCLGLRSAYCSWWDW